jgi:16S rRNA processing protein RimM
MHATPTAAGWSRWPVSPRATTPSGSRASPSLQLDEEDVLLADLIGCTVRRPDGSTWGTVAHVHSHEFQDMLVIHDGEIERLLPLVDEFVTQIDLDERVVHVDPPEGLPESKRSPAR